MTIMIKVDLPGAQTTGRPQAMPVTIILATSSALAQRAVIGVPVGPVLTRMTDAPELAKRVPS